MKVYDLRYDTYQMKMYYQNRDMYYKSISKVGVKYIPVDLKIGTLVIARNRDSQFEDMLNVSVLAVVIEPGVTWNIKENKFFVFVESIQDKMVACYPYTEIEILGGKF